MGVREEMSAASHMQVAPAARVAMTVSNRLSSQKLDWAGWPRSKVPWSGSVYSGRGCATAAIASMCAPLPSAIIPMPLPQWPACTAEPGSQADSSEAEFSTRGLGSLGDSEPRANQGILENVHMGVQVPILAARLAQNLQPAHSTP
jgi:hypothetical protein